jgi:hypothetical protein
MRPNSVTLTTIEQDRLAARCCYRSRLPGRTEGPTPGDGRYVGCKLLPLLRPPAVATVASSRQRAARASPPAVCLQTTIRPSPDLAARCLMWLSTGLMFSRRCQVSPGVWLRWLPDWLPGVLLVISSGQGPRGRSDVRFLTRVASPNAWQPHRHSYLHVTRHTPVTPGLAYCQG